MKNGSTDDDDDDDDSNVKVIFKDRNEQRAARPTRNIWPNGKALRNILALDHSTECIRNFSQRDLCQILSIYSRDIAVTNGVFHNDHVPPLFTCLTSSRRDTNVRLPKKGVS